jgi:hypothetical protein
MSVLYRRALPSGIVPAWPTVRSDWGLFSRALLRRVPAIIADLVASDRLPICVLEDSQSRNPVLMGGFGFLRREFIEHAQRAEGRSVLEQAFDAESRSTPTLLSRRQIVQGNRARDLEMMNFMASPPETAQQSRAAVTRVRFAGPHGPGNSQPPPGNARRHQEALAKYQRQGLRS